MTDLEKHHFPWIDESDFNIIGERIFRTLNKSVWVKKYGDEKLRQIMSYLVENS